MTKKCPRCSKEFECSHSSTCWCSKYTINEKVREYLKNNYQDCLCEECLNSVIKNFNNNA